MKSAVTVNTAGMSQPVRGCQLLVSGLTRADTVRARSFLALVQVPVRGFQQFRRGASVFRKYADADTHAQRGPMRPFTECPLDALRDAICHSGIGVDQ